MLNGVFGSGLGSVMTVHGFGRFNTEVEKYCAEAARSVEDLLAALDEPSAKGSISRDSMRQVMAAMARRLVAEMASSDEVFRSARSQRLPTRISSHSARPLPALCPPGDSNRETDHVPLHRTGA